MNQVRNFVDGDCTILLRICEKVKDEFNVDISKSSIARILDDFYYSLKQVHLIPERRNTESNIQIRMEYSIQFSGLRANY